MTVQITQGDLLKADTDAIVNTVNCVGVMGKGIALQFKQKWPENFKTYAHACKNGKVVPGRMFIYDAGGFVRPHFIINFPTKQDWRGKSKIEFIEEGLDDLIAQVERLGIKSVALPPLGCGNGGLEWQEVRRMILDAFEWLPHVNVLLFEPKGAPAPQEMVNRTKRPAMTPARAAIVKIISIYRQMQYGLSKIEVQKLAYLLEEAGQPLNLAFVKHNYGPYSDKLRHVLKAMDGHYVLGVGDHASEADIVAVPEALAEADRFFEVQEGLEVQHRVEQIAKLIEGFETPYGMELLATVHWVANYEGRGRSAEDAVEAVHDWNERKHRLLQPRHIALAWQRLKENGWINAA
jgi:O-acetyl-ADP-ribose deacetylase (regulator of RNase III)